MFPFDLLGTAFTDHPLIGREVTFVGAPIIRVKLRDAKRLQEGF